MATKELLFEIGTEELPAGFITPALEELEQLIKRGLTKAGLEFASTKTLGTPRRLVLVVEGLSVNKPASSVEVRGPKKEAAYGADGEPTGALLGFAKGQGVKIEDIEIRGDGVKTHVYAKKQIEGEDTINLLPGLLKSLLSANLFPKTMRWGTRDEAFARPIHWITALFGADIVAFDYSGISSTNSTFGHRFMAGQDKEPGSMIVVDGFSGYVQALKEAHVIVDPLERRKIIEEGLEKAAKEAKGELLTDAPLVDEVVNLVEYPVVVMGTFDKEFLDLPKEVVINAMREHQRYFSVTDQSGKLMNYFITVANIEAKDASVVISGNERVLRARLNDAKFFYEQDLKVKLDDWVESLKGVVFQARLGTSFEKVERFTALAETIGNLVNYKEPEKLKRAAFICKADLLSGVVGEFPKLQGVMGKVYAKLAGEPKEVCDAIYEHYMPIAAGGELPKSEAGAIIAIADKMDTIVGCFGVGLMPTGTKDPYALRRAAIGIISILIDKEFDLPLDGLTGTAFDGLSDKLTRDRGEASREVVEFFKERLKNKLLNDGFSFDAIDAVISTENWMDRLVDTVERVKALEAFKKDPDCERLTIAFKRVSNILKSAERIPPKLFSELLTDKEEKELYELSEKIAPKIATFVSARDYEGAFKRLTPITDVLARFFDEVMVMVDDKRVRENRLALLYSVRELYFNIADLSKLQIETASAT